MGISQQEIIERNIVQITSSSAAKDESSDLCCTLEALSSSGVDVWIQILAGTVNSQYPLSEEPKTALSSRGVRLPEDVGLLDWTANSYATFEVSEGVTAWHVAAFVDELFTKILQCDNDYELRASVEDLAN